MIFLFSGLGRDFGQNLGHFETRVGGTRRISLLLQGGTGYEDFLDRYLKPLRFVGLDRVSIIVPVEGEDAISPDQLNTIENSDGVFIGGGSTGVYQNSYCRPDVKQVIHSLHRKQIPIAGLSAGARIMNSSVFVDHSDERPGLGLISETEIFPYFDEEGCAREAIAWSLRNKGRRSLGFDTNCLITIDSDGAMTHHGSGSAFWLFADRTTDGEIRIRSAF